MDAEFMLLRGPGPVSPKQGRRGGLTGPSAIQVLILGRAAWRGCLDVLCQQVQEREIEVWCAAAMRALAPSYSKIGSTRSRPRLPRLSWLVACLALAQDTDAGAILNLGTAMAYIWTCTATNTAKLPPVARYFVRRCSLPIGLFAGLGVPGASRIVSWHRSGRSAGKHAAFDAELAAFFRAYAALHRQRWRRDTSRGNFLLYR